MYDEVRQGIGPLLKVPWILTIFFIVVGILWNIVGIIVALMNTAMKDRNTVIGSDGIYVWSLLTG